jgi:hypothetical protein
VLDVRPTAHKPAAREIFLCVKKNNGRSATGMDHHVPARIADLPTNPENDLKQVAADYASCPSDSANGARVLINGDSVLLARMNVLLWFNCHPEALHIRDGDGFSPRSPQPTRYVHL